MPFRREVHDGDIARRDISFTKRRSSFDNKSTAHKYAASKRARKNPLLLVSNESFEENEADKDRYLITYADVITLLLGLFIILYAISNIDLLKFEKMKTAFESSFGGGQVVGLHKNIPGMEAPADKLKEHLIKLINDNKYGNVIKLDENERGITIHILDEILFTSGDADLSGSSLSVLNNIGNILKDLPNDIRVEGHTDNIPINTDKFPSNWHLSVTRALNTAYYLINDVGLQPDRVSIVGYSKYKPIATNDNPEGRTLNRRVDITIIRK